MGLILQEIKAREEKLKALEKEKLESIQKSVDGKFDEISLKGRHVEEKCKLEIELREKILASKEEMLVAKEKEIEAREKLLDLKTRGFRLPKAGAAQPGELRSKSRKRRKTDPDKGFADRVSELSSSAEATSFDRTTATCDSSESNSSSGNSCSGYSSVSRIDYDYPETEFNDFGKHRKKNCFAAKQFWAIYDKVDIMPRNYAQIMEVNEEKFKFKLRMGSLLADSKYSCNGFPVACGKFHRGKTDDITDTLIFSHQIHCEQNGSDADSYMIYPRKNEIWSLFKDWNIKSNSNSDGSKQYNYEIVEVISDFTENGGVRVVYLDKIRGYVSLFHSADRNATFWIPASEMSRFSHQIPSYRMKGNERNGVPKGSIELDTAALPMVLCDTTNPDIDEVNSKK